MDENFEDADRDNVDRIWDGIEEEMAKNPNFFDEEPPSPSAVDLEARRKHFEYLVNDLIDAAYRYERAPSDHSVDVLREAKAYLLASIDTAIPGPGSEKREDDRG